MPLLSTPPELIKIANAIAKSEGRSILVGGAVRDHCMGRKSLKDFDVEIFGISPEVLESVLRNFGNIHAVGKSFGVLKLKTSSAEYDFSLPRRESRTGKGHRGFMVTPDSTMSYREAASRRDFTVNSIGYDLLTKTLLDPFDGLDGLIDAEIKKASYIDVSGIVYRGGTIIRSSRSKRFYKKMYRQLAYENLKKYSIDKVVVLGGDGTFRAFEIFSKEFGIKFIGVPATIDNDIYGTQYCLGVDTALNVIRSAIDNIRDTASSFNRAFVIETMGRECGYLAAITSLTSGAELCLIPELPFDLNSLKSKFLKDIKNGRRYFIAIVSEGLKIANTLKEWFEKEIGFEARLTVLGHIQRGGNPTIFDRLIAFEFITYAIDLIIKDKKNRVVVYKDSRLDSLPSSFIAKNRYELDKKILDLVKDFTK
ncbi:MAG TPA: ATP-dependent 6-phosphofructokinase [Campylobacterales bacterium]|nr:ATP-dependent 6-phosphofructokinase [Campylobacterales bacterium]